MLPATDSTDAKIRIALIDKIYSRLSDLDIPDALSELGLDLDNVVNEAIENHLNKLSTEELLEVL